MTAASAATNRALGFNAETGHKPTGKLRLYFVSEQPSDEGCDFCKSEVPGTLQLGDEYTGENVRKTSKWQCVACFKKHHAGCKLDAADLVGTFGSALDNSDKAQRMKKEALIVLKAVTKLRPALTSEDKEGHQKKAKKKKSKTKRKLQASLPVCKCLSLVSAVAEEVETETGSPPSFAALSQLKAVFTTSA